MSPGTDFEHISLNAPAALLQSIKKWIRLSMITSALSMALPHFFGKIEESAAINQGPFGPAVFLVILFYDFVVLLLASKEGVLLLKIVNARHEPENPSDEEGMLTSTAWSSLNFWILAVCQSGLAALGLYLAARMALFFGCSTADAGYLFFKTFELVFVLGQMALLTYTATRCIIRNAVCPSVSCFQ
ncbi:hypothetical protein CPC08DRAFT_706379 [Agrocybe pediades]|nr:hypothetical protein CPC08DRAFT_706379 [Agrocybe pediades]